jgi:hypothetical protein
MNATNEGSRTQRPDSPTPTGPVRGARDRLRRSASRLPAFARSRRWQAVVGALAVIAVTGLLCGTDVSPWLYWLDHVRTSRGHEDATREVGRYEGRVSVYDVLSGRAERLSQNGMYPGGPGAMPAGEERPALGATQVVQTTALAATAPPPPPRAGGGDAVPVVLVQPEPGRKIIKNASLALEVKDVPASLGRIGTLAADLGGYVTATNKEESAEWSHATIAFAVPSTQFETALDRLRALAVKVLTETATGEDVTQAYVDLESEVGNLEATRARIRAFLDQAKTVEEALRVNSELTAIEAQISERKGRLQYLSGRSAYSTITVDLQATRPPVTPTATATATPTPTPTPASTWSAGHTATEAYGTLRAIVEALSTVAIWLAVVVLPLVLPVAVAWWLYRRARGRSSGT